MTDKQGVCKCGHTESKHHGPKSACTYTEGDRYCDCLEFVAAVEKEEEGAEKADAPTKAEKRLDSLRKEVAEAEATAGAKRTELAALEASIEAEASLTMTQAEIDEATLQRIQREARERRTGVKEL